MLNQFLLLLVTEIFAFQSNADASNILVFGRDMQTWLNYSLILLAMTSVAFVSVWLFGFIRDQKSDKSIQNPWD